MQRRFSDEEVIAVQVQSRYKGAEQVVLVQSRCRSSADQGCRGSAEVQRSEVQRCNVEVLR